MVILRLERSLVSVDKNNAMLAYDASKTLACTSK